MDGYGFVEASDLENAHSLEVFEIKWQFFFQFLNIQVCSGHCVVSDIVSPDHAYTGCRGQNFPPNSRRHATQHTVTFRMW